MNLHKRTQGPETDAEKLARYWNHDQATYGGGERIYWIYTADGDYLIERPGPANAVQNQDDRRYPIADFEDSVERAREWAEHHPR